MKPTFSQRFGLVPHVANVIQIDSINTALRNGLWSTLCLGFFDYIGSRDYISDDQELFLTYLWKNYFKLPTDTISQDPKEAESLVRKYYFGAEWNIAYEFIEFVASYCDTRYPKRNIYVGLNQTLQSEFSAYRFINRELVDITSKQEAEALEQAIEDTQFKGVSTHIATALKLYSDKNAPDYRNSIKESISAVESMARIVTGLPKATLGQALKELKKNHTIHPALINGFDSLYGYTSDEGGIRHSMQDEPDLTSAEAKYFLLSCTSFVNYLKTKM